MEQGKRSNCFMLLLLFLLHERYTKGNANHQKVSSHPLVQNTTLHLKSGAMISVFVPKTTRLSHQPLSSMVIFTPGYRTSLPNVNNPFFSIASGTRGHCLLATELKWKSRRLTPYINNFLSSECGTKTLHGSMLGDSTTSGGRRRVYWQNMLWTHGHLIWKKSMSNREDNLRAFVSFSFPLEIFQHQPILPSGSLQPTF